MLASKITQLRELNSLKLFKQQHNLTIDPKYEISPWFTFGSLCTAGSLETALNTPFFSITSEGLVNAAGIAAQVSATNVFIGFAVGFLLIRYSLHVNRKHRIWTVPLSLLAFFVGITFNITMGSYREGLKSNDPMLNFATVYIDTIKSIAGQGSNGLSLDLPSFALIIVGLAIFSFAIYKGVKHNDPYPEYANRHLRFLEADEDLILTEQAIRQQLGDTIRTFNEELTQTIELAVSSPQSRDVTVPSVDQVQGFLDWQSDRVTTMIAGSEQDATDKFANEVQINLIQE